jgi:hypothetical protein
VVAVLRVDAMEHGRRHLWRHAIMHPRDGVLPVACTPLGCVMRLADSSCCWGCDAACKEYLGVNEARPRWCVDAGVCAADGWWYALRLIAAAPLACVRQMSGRFCALR